MEITYGIRLIKHHEGSILEMAAAKLIPAYEVLRDAIVDANRREVALRLKDAGFDPDFATDLFPSRGCSSIRSSSAPTAPGSRRRRRSSSVESDFQPRRSTRHRSGVSYREGAEVAHTKETALPKTVSKP